MILFETTYLNGPNKERLSRQTLGPTRNGSAGRPAGPGIHPACKPTKALCAVGGGGGGGARAQHGHAFVPRNFG